MWAHWYLFYTWVTIQHYFICYFIAQMFAFGHWNLYRLALVFLWHTPIFVDFLSSISLLSDTSGCSGFTLYIPFPSPRISHFPKDHMMSEFVFTYAILSHLPSSSVTWGPLSSFIGVDQKGDTAMGMEVGASVWVNICLLHLYLRHLYGPVILQNGAIPSSQFGDPRGCRGRKNRKRELSGVIER